VKRRLILALLAVSTAAAQTGDWIAVLDLGQVKLRVALHLAAGAGTADSIDQDAFDLPLTAFHRGSRRLSFEVARLGSRFAGEFSPDGQALDGVWAQRQGSLPLRFHPGNLRPQEPRPPYPYKSEAVNVRNGIVHLAGTLTIPAASGPQPAVILLTGSGPQDRNDTVSGHRPFLTWSDRLTRRGFAVLRLDDRGVGGSGGKLLESTDEDFANDALAAVGFLQHRPEIDARSIGLLGHSEGAIVAPLAAAKSGSVAFVVLLAAPAIPGDQLQLAQSERVSRAMGVTDEIARGDREAQQKLFGMARSGAGVKQMRTALTAATAKLPPDEASVVRGRLMPQLAIASSRWFRFILGYDPLPALEKVQCPVLAIYGTLDLQVPADLNSPPMKRALARNPQHRVVVIPGVNHMLQHARTGSPLEYSQIEETVAEDVLELVGQWLEAVRGQK
jgi:pimeloyl-ACP methyl ester carboxylesterase